MTFRFKVGDRVKRRYGSDDVSDIAVITQVSQGHDFWKGQGWVKVAHYDLAFNDGSWTWKTINVPEHELEPADGLEAIFQLIP